MSVSDEFIAVGAYGSDIVTGTQESLDSGAVYAFRRPQDGWVSSSNAQKLTTKDPASGDTFGYAVAVSGDTLGRRVAQCHRPAVLLSERGSLRCCTSLFMAGPVLGRHPRGVQDQTAQRRIFPYLRGDRFRRTAIRRYWARFKPSIRLPRPLARRRPLSTRGGTENGTPPHPRHLRCPMAVPTARMDLQSPKTGTLWQLLSFPQTPEQMASIQYGTRLHQTRRRLGLYVRDGPAYDAQRRV